MRAHWPALLAADFFTTEVWTPGRHRLLTGYITYYMESRTHLALEKDTPISRPVIPSSVGRTVVTPHVGGLHHRYDRAAA